MTITADWTMDEDVSVGEAVVRVGQAGHWQPASGFAMVDAAAGIQYGKVTAYDDAARRVCIEPMTVAAEPIPE